eukprot:Colp12_sorted_trinity150504_noHs@32740
MSSIETAWKILRASVPLSDGLFFCIGTGLVHTTVYFGLNTLFDLAHRYNWWAQYKIQKEKYPSAELVSVCFRRTLINHFVVQYVTLYLLLPVFFAFGIADSSKPFPTFSELCLQLFVSLAIEDTLFYWSHRLLHHR